MEKTTPDGKNAKITEITYPEKRKMFTEVNGVHIQKKKQNHHIQQLVIQLINSRRSK